MKITAITPEPPKPTLYIELTAAEGHDLLHLAGCFVAPDQCMQREQTKAFAKSLTAHLHEHGIFAK